MRIVALLGTAAFLVVSSVASAQSRTVVGAIGAQHLQSDGAGLSMLLGVGLARSTFVVSLPVELTILPNSDSRYRTDTFSNGQSRCRDTSNGQFADTSLCGPRVVAGMSLDALGFVKTDSSHALGFGAGYRVGPSAGPFAAAQFSFGLPSATSWNLKARVGTELLEVSLGGALRWR